MVKKIGVLLFLAVVGQAFAQTSFKGKIVDSNNAAIAFANVVAMNKSDSTLLKGAITDMDGLFNIDIRQPQNSYLSISYVGFQTKTVTDLSNTNLGNITLEDQTQALEEVAVVGQKPFIQKEQDKLVLNIENSIVNTGNSTMELLEKAPGVIIDQDDVISLSGRTGVRIYMDGKDTRLQGEQLANLLRSLPSSNIEKIEIITNPSVRYEAQGNAGIINIVTKKGKLYGTNGSLTLSPGYGRYFRWNSAMDFNHRTEKLNLYGQYSYTDRNQYQEIVIDRIFLDGDQPQGYYDLQNDFELPLKTHTGRLGLDYTVSEKTTLGVLFTGLNNNTKNISTSNVLGYNTDWNLISEENTATDIASEWNQFTANLNARHNFGNKSVLNFNFDHARYSNWSDQKFVSNFDFFESNTTAQDVLLGDVDGFLNLTGITVDYELPFKNGDRFEAGWKNTWVKSDNDLAYVNENNGVTTPNTNLSNHFIYDEDIYAGYVSYNINREKWNAQVGLRAENTSVIGNQVTTNTVNTMDYLNLFPTASYNYTFNEKHTLGVSAGRRIDRPGYGQLNPFRTFVNTNTYREGNPYLQPQFTWVSEVNYTFKQRYYFAFNVGITEDHLTMAIIRDGDQEVVIVRPINIDRLKSYSFVASLPIQFSNWWQSNWNLNASINDFDGEINGFNFDRSNPVVSLNTNHSFGLGNGYRLQAGAFYLFPHYGSITRAETISSYSVGLQKNLFKDAMTLRFNINDIFWNQYPTGRTAFGNLDDSFTSYRDTRYATLSISWRFGKQSVQPVRRRQSEIQQEMDRARQQNEG
ncbi:TonB-dependent receptor [Flagellimonas olearia]|uniref:TonB-dependent receptor n=1 Tax=Flagellimonas olearia TaxID=552546 RepID=A0A6I1E4U1_9FLAO|nr:TonB-dependent receptor [Allomuricauda olearia]KAB7531532.1 TonB-dependent receptor [Allomuricauda olearia]